MEISRAQLHWAQVNDKYIISSENQIKEKWEGLKRSPRLMSTIQWRKTFCTATSVHTLIMHVHAHTITQEIFHKAVQHMWYNLLFSILSFFFFFPNAGCDSLFHDPPMSHKTVCKALSQGQHCLFQADKTRIPEIFSRTYQSRNGNPRWV